MIVCRQELHIPLAKPTLSEDFLGVFVVDISDFIFKFVIHCSVEEQESWNVGIRCCILMLHSCVHICFSFQILFCFNTDLKNINSEQGSSF